MSARTVAGTSFGHVSSIGLPAATSSASRRPSSETNNGLPPVSAWTLALTATETACPLIDASS